MVNVAEQKPTAATLEETYKVLEVARSLAYIAVHQYILCLFCLFYSWFSLDILYSAGQQPWSDHQLWHLA